METGTFEFRYPHGHMRIRVDEFFPTSPARTRKLVKVICMGQNPETVLSDLLSRLEEGLNAAEDPEELKRLANDCAAWHTKATELGPEIEKQERWVGLLDDAVKAEGRKSPNRERLKKEKEKLKDMKQMQKWDMQASKDAAKTFEDQKKRAYRYRQDIKEIREALALWT